MSHKMKFIVISLAIASLTACAAATGTGVSDSAFRAKVSNIVIYNDGNKPQSDYTMLGQVQAEACENEKQARANIKVEVVKMGGNAALNVTCEDKGANLWCYHNIVCYADVIVVKGKQ